MNDLDGCRGASADDRNSAAVAVVADPTSVDSAAVAAAAASAVTVDITGEKELQRRGEWGSTCTTGDGEVHAGGSGGDEDTATGATRGGVAVELEIVAMCDRP